MSGVAIAASELYDQGGKQTLATVAMTTARPSHGSVRLPNGKVRVADGSGAVLASAELYQESYPVKYRQYLSTVAVQGGP